MRAERLVDLVAGFIEGAIAGLVLALVVLGVPALLGRW